jgi:hypothetical protein
MIKKVIAGLIASSIALFALPNNEVELVLISKALEKKAIVLSNMGLQGETKEKFGKLYDEYQEKLMKQRVEELQLIKSYAASYNNLTDKKADELIKTWVASKDTGLTLQKNYMAKFKKIMPSSDVIRYFQIEHRLQIMREAQISSVVPLAMPAPAPLEAK